MESQKKKKSAQVLKPFPHNFYLKDPLKCLMLYPSLGPYLSRILSEGLRQIPGRGLKALPWTEERLGFSA
jgi:hypothetical protein